MTTSTPSTSTPTTGRGPNGGLAQGDQLQDAASGLLSQATRTAEAQASTTMTRVGDTLQSVASAVREAGSELRDTQPEIAGFADTAAARVDEAATYLRDHGPAEAIDNLQRVARQQPALVVGGGLLAGIVIGRFLRTGATQAGQDDWRQSGQLRYGASGSAGSVGYPSGGVTRASTSAGSYSGVGTGAATGSVGTAETDLTADSMTEDLGDEASRREPR